MKPEDVVGLVVFLWLAASYGILRFIGAARPYQEDSEEQKADDAAQERALEEAWRKRKAKAKAKRG
jgi:hypothetical protein